jgi:hypothetical protein
MAVLDVSHPDICEFVDVKQAGAWSISTCRSR